MNQLKFHTIAFQKHKAKRITPHLQEKSQQHVLPLLHTPLLLRRKTQQHPNNNNHNKNL